MQPDREFEHSNLNPFQAIFDQAPDALIFADRDGIIQVWNRGPETVFGYAAGEVTGKSLDVIIPERLRSAHWEGFRRAIETGETKYGNRVLTAQAPPKISAAHAATATLV